MSQRLLHYDIIERLGEGAGSTIYRARDSRTGREVALKHVVRHNPKDIRFVEQMEAEFEIARQFNHPNLRRTFDLKISKSMLLKITEAYLILELVEGHSLDVKPPQSMLEALDTFIQAGRGLQYMHNLGYVHCDMKPNNIMRDTEGMVKVIDYGQSCPIGTIKDRIQGTPDFIAPEQVLRKPVDITTDAYNFGATLYWALTGTHIPTAYTVKKKGGDNAFLVDSRIQTPQDLNPRVPPVVSQVVMECVASKQSKRPGNMESVVHKLEIGRHILTRDESTYEDFEV
ncbi:MAG: serine/threonine-protein kinase [Planctomycetota bacterium]